MTMKTLAAAACLTTTVFCSTAQAATVFGDEFSLFGQSNSFRGSATTDVVIAGVNQEVVVEPLNTRIGVTFTDDDSFFVVAEQGIAFSDIFTIELTGLDFMDGGAAAPITSLMFNSALTDIRSFNAGRDFSLLEASSTSNSLTIRYELNSTELAADQPEIFFDIGFGDPGNGGGGNGGAISAVPLPAGGLLLLSGLGGVAALKRRKKRAA